MSKVLHTFWLSSSQRLLILLCDEVAVRVRLLVCQEVSALAVASAGLDLCYEVPALLSETQATRVAVWHGDWPTECRELAQIDPGPPQSPQ